MMTTFRVPYGKTEIEFELPSGMTGTLAVSKSPPPIEDVPAAVKKALETPVNSPPVRKLAKRGDKVCIIFTDITRASPDYLLVPPLLAELKTARVCDEDVTLLCGVGMHRPSTHEEKIAKLGKAVVDRYQVVDHESQNSNMLVDLGKTESGIPLSVNKIAYEADLIMATGIVEPHQYAGYSGGPKTLAVGAAGETMIAYTHGPNMAEHPGTRLGRLEGNPFHEAVVEAARRAGLRFVINVIMDEEKRVVAVRAGEPEKTLEELVKIARTAYEVPVPKQYEVAVAGVGFPKDANLYQASRAATYLFFAPTPVLKLGGIFIIPARCEEGVGQGVGEQRFLKEMQRIKDIPSFLAELRRTGYPPGAQRAFLLAKVLEKNDVIIVGSDYPDIIRETKMIPAADMREAFQIASKKLGDKLDVLIIPHALLTLPIVRAS
jgi:nickel-dependent lactate racemase